MRIICIDSLNEGMALARDLYASNGRLILVKGSTIKKRHIEIMRCWGVSEASVCDPEETPSPEKTKLPEGELSSFTKRKFNLLPPSELRDFLINFAAISGSGNVPVIPAVSCNKVKNKEYDVPFSLGELVAREPGLSGFSPVLSKILKVLSSPDSSAIHIAEAVSNDSAMTFKILRLVNSPLYAFPRHIKSVVQAVAIIGSEDLMNIAIQISSIAYFKGISSNLINMKYFWVHSISCAIFARILASRKFRGDDSHYFVGGMCLNLGRLVVLRDMPEVFEHSLALSYEEGIPLSESEIRIMGYSSDDISRNLFERWFIPTELGTALSMRSNRDFVMTDMDSAIFHVAETLAVAVGNGFAGDYFVPTMIDGVLDFLGYSVNDIGLIVSQFQRQQREIINAFLGGERI